MNKLNKEQITEIKESIEKPVVLAKKFNVTIRTIMYHRNPEEKNKTLEYNRKRYNNLTKEQKKEILDRKRDYQREYHKNRYKKDIKFREKQIKSSIKSNNKRNSIQLKGGEYK